MTKIHLLAEHDINQIAAGEVIENPASVVKELVENALDAGATRLVIEIKGGGQQLIRILDNGSGMDREDALLCLQRYATSKIREVKDLWKLSTLGFRGEALASIAAISKMTLMTSTGREPAGIQIEVEGGQVLTVTPCARSRGTTIEVRSLFYNVPARKKFQKSASVNAGEISRLITALSLAHPHVGFELIQQEQTTLSAAESDTLAQRIAKVLGAEFTCASFPVVFEEGSVHLRGVVGSPSNSRPQRTGQYLFINGRLVFSPLISYAVREGFGTRVAENRHPLYVLHLNLPPSLIDVNVHPQKKEVRFQEEKYIRAKVVEAVSAALQMKPDSGYDPLPLLFSGDSYAQFCTQVLDSPAIAAEEKIWKNSFPPLRFKEEKEEPVPVLPLQPQEIRTIGVFREYLLLDASSLEGRVVGAKEGILLVDLRAASARVAFDSLLSREIKGKEKQGLLIPLTVEISSAEAEIIKENSLEIEEIGFSLRSLGKNSFIIDALPSFMEPADAIKALHEMGDEMRALKGRSALQEERIRILAATASRFASRRKEAYTKEEAVALFEELLSTSAPYHCPRGKPTLVCLNLHEIAKYFV